MVTGDRTRLLKGWAEVQRKHMKQNISPFSVPCSERDTLVHLNGICLLQKLIATRSIEQPDGIFSPILPSLHVVELKLYYLSKVKKENS